MASPERYGSDYEPHTNGQGGRPARFTDHARDSEGHEDERRHPGASGPSMTDTYERDDRTRRDQPRHHRSDERGDGDGRGRVGWGGHDPRSSYQGADRGEDYGRAGYRQESGEERDSGRQAAYDREYARWRQNQMTRLDQDYQDYLAERQDRFNADFDAWRSERQSTAATDTGNPMMSSTQKAVEGNSDKTKTRN